MTETEIIEVFRILELEAEKQRKRYQEMAQLDQKDTSSQVKIIVADNTRSEVSDAKLERCS